MPPRITPRLLLLCCLLGSSPSRAQAPGPQHNNGDSAASTRLVNAGRASTDAAQESKAPGIVKSGPELGFRAGYAVVAGRVNPGQRLRRSAVGAIPLWLDIGYRINPQWFVGLYGQWALGISSKTSENECQGCTHSWVRGGAQVMYRFYENANQNLWLGLGLGRQWFNTSIDEEARKSERSQGWEILNLQLGSDVRVNEGIALGSYSSVMLGNFDSRVSTCLRRTLCPVERESLPVDTGSMHAWFSAGLRVVLLP